MDKSVFDFDDYKRYIHHVIRAKGHGFRSRMAEALSCHTAYVTQVLNKSAHFSLEQAEAFNRLMSHDKDESYHLLLLVQHARAGTRELRARLAEQIQQAVQKRLVFKNRVDIRESLPKEQQTKYYSAWYFAAVHVLVSIPEFRTVEAMQRRLGLSKERLIEVLEFLAEAGLVHKEGDHYRPGLMRIFLERDSDMYSRHHVNLRLKGIESLDRGGPHGNLHFASMVSVARADVPKIQEALIQGVESARRLIKESKEEELCCLTMDFFAI